MKVCIFDICGTLYKANTTFAFLEYTFKNKAAYRWYRKLYHTYCWKIFNRLLRDAFHIDLTRILALKFLKGFNRNELIKLVNIYYDDYLSNKKNEVLINELTKYLNDKRYRVILMSATIDVVGQVIGERLRCSELYTTKLEYERDICTGNISQDLLGNKMSVVKQLGINKDITLFATDDFTDIPLLSIAKNKVIIEYKKYKRKWEKEIKLRQWNVKTVED